MTNAAVGMPSPVCRIPLVMSDRQGVEVDYCPQCRGVWLDRGELDKIIERSQHAGAVPPSQPTAGTYAQHSYGDHGHKHRHGYPKRKKSFLEELFD